MEPIPRQHKNVIFILTVFRVLYLSLFVFNLIKNLNEWVCKNVHPNVKKERNTVKNLRKNIR
jgi:hypothetical protein